MLCNSAQDIHRVNSNADSLVGKADQSVVEEHIEPLLVEGNFLLQQIGLTAVNQLVVSQMFFESLHNSDPHLHVMGTVSEDQLASLLSLARTLFDQCAVASEQMFFEESVEL